MELHFYFEEVESQKERIYDLTRTYMISVNNRKYFMFPAVNII